jgi:hypothetical protein
MENRTFLKNAEKRNKEQREEIIEMWRQSGKNKKVFCEENNLNYMTFISWSGAKKSRRKKYPVICDSGFTPLNVPGNASGLFAEIVYANGNAINLHQSLPVEYLRTLVK